MDAAAADSDVKLYKASSELLAELQAKLPYLLSKPSGQPRRWILFRKTSEIAQLLDSFQEWPQLLDPILAGLVGQLAEAFLDYCHNGKEEYRHHKIAESKDSEPLPRTICRLLYVLCKVRGYKIILGLLNNEPKCLEPLLVCFYLWNGQIIDTPIMSWQERYIMLLWLSHLMLAPFQLDSISGLLSDHDESRNDLNLKAELPGVANTLLSLASRHLCLASKDREAARQLIVRLALRQDMQQKHLPEHILTWCRSQLVEKRNPAIADQYRTVGVLTLMHGMVSTLTSTEAEPYLSDAFATVQYLSSSSDQYAMEIRQPAPARKLLIKLMRTTVLHSTALAETGSKRATDNVDNMLEQTIQILLDWLADSDTPVRQAASKALGMIALKLDSEMSAEIIEAVLSCFDDNILLEDRKTGTLTPATDLINIDIKVYKKNVNAVDPLKWHGAMLTLGHVLFRRSPPPSQLSIILDALIMGLQFEQRSNVGTSLGVGVRDAACFGIWSLARKYSTQEINTAGLTPTTSLVRRLHSEESTLQIVATELILASCLDPSGNLRRGASAALQEMIGRHPDIILEGISVVQRVDYHDVARRSKAMTMVSLSASQLGRVYHQSLLFSLLDWRGCRAVDADSRRQAAQSIGQLYGSADTVLRQSFLDELMLQIGYLAPANNGINAASRHGLLCSLSAVLQVHQNSQVDDSILIIALSSYSDLTQFLGILSGRVTTDLIHVLEATCKLIEALTGVVGLRHLLMTAEHLNQTVLEVLDRCATASEDDLLCDLASNASIALATITHADDLSNWLNSWIPTVIPKHRSSSTAICRGRIMSLSHICRSVQNRDIIDKLVEKVTSFLVQLMISTLAIETRVSAMQGISILVQKRGISIDVLERLIPAINVGLNDYTNDQRGDVGSWLRLVSIEAVHNLPLSNIAEQHMTTLLQSIVCLAAEKLGKVRFAAWNCLLSRFPDRLPSHATNAAFQYQSDVSTDDYFTHLLGLLQVEPLRDVLLKGLVGTICQGAEDASLSASGTLITFLHTQTQQKQSEVLQKIVVFLVSRIHTNKSQEDREVVPFLETLCLISEQFPCTIKMMLDMEAPTIFSLLDDIQTPSADIPRIQALLRLMSFLASDPKAFPLSANKVSRKLLHKWPKVRQAAADVVFLLDENGIDPMIDWNSSATSNKPHVLAARKILGVSGKQ